MLNNLQSQSKVDLKFSFYSLELNISFACEILIQVTTNQETKETESTLFQVSQRNPVGTISKNLIVSFLYDKKKQSSAKIKPFILIKDRNGKEKKKCAGQVTLNLSELENGKNNKICILEKCPDKKAKIKFSVEKIGYKILANNEIEKQNTSVNQNENSFLSKLNETQFSINRYKNNNRNKIFSSKLKNYSREPRRDKSGVKFNYHNKSNTSINSKTDILGKRDTSNAKIDFSQKQRHVNVQKQQPQNDLLKIYGNRPDIKSQNLNRTLPIMETQKKYDSKKFQKTGTLFDGFGLQKQKAVDNDNKDVYEEKEKLEFNLDYSNKQQAYEFDMKNKQNNEQIQELQKQIDELNAQLISTKEELKLKNEQYEEKNKKYKELCKEMEAIHDDQSDQEDVIDELKYEIEQQEKKLKLANENFKILEQQNLDLQQQIKNFTEKVQQLEEQKQQLQQNQEVVQNQLDDKKNNQKQEIESLNSLIEIQNKNYALKQQYLQNLLKSKNKEIDNVNQQLSVFKQYSNDLKKKNIDLQIKIEDAQESIDNNSIVQSDQRVKDLKKDLEEYKQQLSEQIKKNEELQIFLDEINAQYQSSQNMDQEQLKQLQIQIHQLQIKLNINGSDNAEKFQTNDSSTQNKQIIKERDEQIKNYQIQAKEMQDQIEKLEKILEQKKLNHKKTSEIELEDQQKTQNQIKTLEQQLKDQKDKNEDMQFELKELEDQLQTELKKNNMLRSSIIKQQSNEDIDQLAQEQIAKLKSENHEQEKEIADQKFEIQEMKRKIVELDVQLKVANKQNRTQENQSESIENLQQQLEEFKQKSQEFQENNKELQKEIEELQNKNKKNEKLLQRDQKDLQNFESKYQILLQDKKNLEEKLKKKIAELNEENGQLQGKLQEVAKMDQSDTFALQMIENEELKKKLRLIEFKLKQAQENTTSVDILKEKDQEIQNLRQKLNQKVDEILAKNKKISELEIKSEQIVDKEQYKKLETDYVSSMKKIGDALMIIQDMNIKNTLKDKLISTLMPDN